MKTILKSLGTEERRGIIARTLIRIARSSWRCYRFMSFVARASNLNIPIHAGIGLQLLASEESVGPVLRAVWRPGSRGTFVDIGANIGSVLLELLKIDRDIPYIGFEPSLYAASYMQRLIDANGLTATHAVCPIALADECGPAVLLRNHAHDESATIALDQKPEGMYRDRFRVCVSTGDIQLREVGQIDVIKIDVEGGERRVLAGLTGTIRKHRPALVIEILPYSHFENDSYNRAYFGSLSEPERQRLGACRKQNMSDLAEFMSENDYRLFQLRDGTLQLAQPADSSFANPDFVALPAENLNRFGVASK